MDFFLTSAVGRPENVRFEIASLERGESVDLDAHQSPDTVPLFLSFLPALIVYGVIGYVLRQAYKREQQKRERGISVAVENTNAVLANTELLQENITLQREILDELRKRNSGG